MVMIVSFQYSFTGCPPQTYNAFESTSLLYFNVSGVGGSALWSINGTRQVSTIPDRLVDGIYNTTYAISPTGANNNTNITGRVYDNDRNVVEECSWTLTVQGTHRDVHVYYPVHIPVLVFLHGIYDDHLAAGATGSPMYLDISLLPSNVPSGPLEAPRNFSVTTNDTSFVLHMGAPFTLIVDGHPSSIFYYTLCITTLCTDATSWCRNISPQPDCIFPEMCTLTVDDSLAMNHSCPITFSLYAVNGAGNGTVATANLSARGTDIL